LRRRSRGQPQKNLPPEKLKMLPHMPSMYAGMIGAFLHRLAIASRPRWKGSITPVRAIPPSGKMPTTSPRSRASAAFLRVVTSSLGGASWSIGMAPPIRPMKLRMRFS
jgi:hypothetical protein